MTGGTGKDVLVGDNGSVVAGGIAGGRTVTLPRPDDRRCRHHRGRRRSGLRLRRARRRHDLGRPRRGRTPVLGSPAADYIEGDDGDDAIHGEAGDDDLVGGGSAIDGVIDADRTAPA